MLNLDQLDIRRVIVHHFPRRQKGIKQQVEPSLEQALYTLTAAGKGLFGRRIAEALGHRSHGIQADFVEVGERSFFQIAVQSMLGDDAEFIAGSHQMAAMLARAQGLKDLAASKLLVVSGAVTEFQRPFIAVIKAEMQDAFSERKIENSHVVIDYIRDIFLTETQRLFKIGFVQQTVVTPDVSLGAYTKDDFSVHLFDHLLTGTETRSAAFYFYSEFLGADVAASDKRLTQEFYEKTLQFIDAQSYTPAQRIEKLEDLRSHLRSNSQTILVEDFANSYLSVPERTAYADYMVRSGFPTHAITKDVSYVKNKLRRRQKVVFDSGVMITTPADQLNLIDITPLEDGTVNVRITGKIQSQE
ncbi:nucleoid-associated protein [Herbaspirillum huttiense]|uniref:nucleoid-associated protein n=1 Tax=Herbaspirillum huttiense TaxID=863372 RepID=UPI0039B05AB2